MYDYVVEDGRKYGYPECCIETFHKLIQHDISPALIMDWMYGMDTAENRNKYIRCPSCREYGGPFELTNFVTYKSELELLAQHISDYLITIEKFNLLPNQNHKSCSIPIEDNPIDQMCWVDIICPTCCGPHFENECPFE
ncbi:hypothetical protein LCGC14_2247010 [marine sediment metagenome]|uniref:Uncharacterized protein n=1 Tax=marine sediment metagenome TaxID=412755 RepID=A0A0F9DR99_9ZZZZ